MSGSIILLGDSIFDNAIYVPGEPCVTEQLRELVPGDVEVQMLPVDGNFVVDVSTQLEKLPEQATHLFVSVGGNDALSHYASIKNDFRSSEELLTKWTEVKSDFRGQYRAMLERVTSMNRQTAVCTIYDAVPMIESFAITALSFFNDVIISERADRGLPIIDLRKVCPDNADYSVLSPIEPSCKGGVKIASALMRVFREHDFTNSVTTIYNH